jgi:hypothetical protein
MDINKKKVYKMKHYSHFDKKVHWKNVRHIVENPEWVAKHGFFPFIHYTQNIKKCNKNAGRKPPKLRDIFYSSHIDRYIYELYSYKLNCIYNKRVVNDCTNKCAIAYRNNLHKSNIHFAKKVFDAIRRYKQAFIIIGDFTSFFDSLDHAYLKDRLCNLLETTKLQDDYYAVFKNITKFSYFELDKLKEINRLTYRELNKKDRVLEIKDFRKYKKECLRKNQNNYGIPQGSAISSVLSNIYMLDFDKKVNDFITSKKGIYMRYSDDFVIVVPKCEIIELQKMWEYINNVIKSIKNLNLQQEKTQVFEYDNSNVISCNRLLFPEISNGKNIINYLGFSFDGKVVTIRDKTITKYYYRMYRKIDNIAKTGGVSKKGKRIPMDKLYKKYSFYGEVPTKNNKGNFLTYVNRAKKIFGPNEAIDRSTKNHWGKLHKRLRKSWKEYKEVQP